MKNIYGLLVDLRPTRGWRKEERHMWFLSMTNMNVHIPLRKKPRRRMHTIFEPMERMVTEVEVDNLFRSDAIRRFELLGRYFRI